MRECENGRRQTKSISEQEEGEERREFPMPCNSIFDGIWQFEVLSFLSY